MLRAEVVAKIQATLDGRIKELEEDNLSLRMQMAQLTIDKDSEIFAARFPSLRAIENQNLLNRQKDAEIEDLQNKLRISLAEREVLITQAEDHLHQAEVSQFAANDLQRRLTNLDGRIQHHRNTIVQERVKIRKAVELSELYLRFYQIKEKVKTFKDCQTSATLCGRVLLGLIALIGGLATFLFAIFVGGEAIGGAAYFLNAPTLRVLDSEKKRLRDRLAVLQGQLALGPIHPELYDSLRNVYRW